MRSLYLSLLAFCLCFALLTSTSKAACNAAFQFTMGNCPTIGFFDGSTSNSGAVTQWSWTFGDGGTSTLQNPTHTYTANGTYTVCLVITTQFGCGSQYCATVNITCIQPSQCQAGFTTNLNGCPQILFTSTSVVSGGSISAYNWTFGDGGTSTTQNPAHTYLTNGNYAVCLTITTTTGCTSTFCDTISITCNVGQCQAGFQYTSGQCPTISFFDGSSTTSGTITGRSWTFGDGGTSTAQNPSHTYTANGTYQVCLTITTSTGCTNTYCANVVISCIQPPQCQANFSVNLTGCPQILFTDLSTPTNGISAWSWTFGDGGTSTAQNPAHTYLTNGNYVVCLTITTPNQCTSTFCDTIAITCNTATCNAAFQFTMPQCPTVSFFDGSSTTSGTITGRSWTFGDGGTSTLPNPSHTYTANGTYQACLTITTSTGCTDTYCTNVVIACIQPPQCQANFSVNLTGCPQILFTDLSTPANGISAWSWTFGDGGTSTAQNPAHTYLTNGNYVVCLTITTPNQCTSTYCDTISITCNQGQCQAAFAYQWTPNLLAYFVDQSSSSSGPIVAWYWTFGDGGTSTLQNPSHVYAVAGQYPVCLTITTGSTIACTSTTCDTVTIGTVSAAESSPFTALAAAPNPFDDGLNITYTLTGYMPVELALYDIQGRKVAVLDQGDRAPGTHTVACASTQLAQGLYHLRLSGPSGSRSMKVVHVK